MGYDVRAYKEVDWTPFDIATHRFVHKLGQLKKDFSGIHQLKDDLWNRETHEEYGERVHWEQSFRRKLIYRTSVNNCSSSWIMTSALGADGLLCFGGLTNVPEGLR